MSDRIVAVDKPLGPTPLQFLDTVRRSVPELRDEHLGFAGRLDPMAEGVLLMLVGDATKRVKDLRALEKTYEVDVLAGLRTDTFDSLGLVTSMHPTHESVACDASIVQRFVGTIEQQYPPYSSARVNGRPLYHWAREGRLHEIQLPVATRRIDAIEVLGQRSLSGDALVDEALQRTAMVEGEFRQDAIIARWEQLRSHLENRVFPVLSLRVHCGPGTYMRALADALGTQWRCGAMAWRIVRTREGQYRREDCRIMADNARELHSARA